MEHSAGKVTEEILTGRNTQSLLLGVEILLEEFVGSAINDERKFLSSSLNQVMTENFVFMPLCACVLECFYLYFCLKYRP